MTAGAPNSQKPPQSGTPDGAAGVESFPGARDFIPGECWHCGADVPGGRTLCRGCERTL